MTQEFSRFLIAGGVAAIANFGSRFIFSIFFSYSTAVFFACLVGMAVAFLIMRTHVFRSLEENLSFQLIKFAIVNTIAVLQTIIISNIVANFISPYFGNSEYALSLAHFVGILFPILTSYIGHKFFTFN